MKTSTILKRAEKYLWDGVGSISEKDCCICIALKRVVDPAGLHVIATGKLAALYNVIGDRLRSPYYTYWAVRKGHLPRRWEDKATKWYPIIQANRLNWMRELQREYRAKGD